MDEQEILKFYKSGYSMNALSKEYNIPLKKLRDLLILNGITIRTKTEALQKYVRYRECIICGRIFRVKSKWNAKGSRYRKTCSEECQSELRSQTTRDSWTKERRERISKRFTGRDTSTWDIAKRERKPNWKGGYTSTVYTDIAFNELGLERKCECCGSIDNICVHHKDKNRAHNTIENIVVLCKSCHTKLHNLQKDVGVNCPNGFNNRKRYTL